MLSAVTESSSKHDVVRRTLMMILAGNRPVSGAVGEYFNQVLYQARALLQDPASLNKDTYPESIELAIELRDHSDLSDEMAHINGISDVSSSVAEKLLKAMKDHNTVHQD